MKSLAGRLFIIEVALRTSRLAIRAFQLNQGSFGMRVSLAGLVCLKLSFAMLQVVGEIAVYRLYLSLYVIISWCAWGFNF